MNNINVTVKVDEIGCTASLNVDLDAQGPDYWEQFDTRGEAIESVMADLAEKIGAQLRQEYDKRDAINQRVKELGA